MRIMSNKKIKKQEKCEASLQSKVINFVNDENVKNDIVFRLGLVSVIGLYQMGVQRDDVQNLEIMPAASIAYLLEKYRPDYFHYLSSEQTTFFAFLELFYDSVRTMARSLFILCLKTDDPKHPTLDIEELLRVRHKLLFCTGKVI